MNCPGGAVNRAGYWFNSTQARAAMRRRVHVVLRGVAGRADA